MNLCIYFILGLKNARPKTTHQFVIITMITNFFVVLLLRWTFSHRSFNFWRLFPCRWLYLTRVAILPFPKYREVKTKLCTVSREREITNSKQFFVCSQNMRYVLTQALNTNRWNIKSYRSALGFSTRPRLDRQLSLNGNNLLMHR